MRNKIMLLIISFTTFAYTNNLNANTSQGLPTIIQPIFLKPGFSSVIEFNVEPEKIIIGDSQNFQVEKTNKSLVIRCLRPYASSNLFVYFKKHPTQIFSLTADEEAIPTLLKKIILNELTSKIESETALSKKEDVQKIKKNTIRLILKKTEFSRAKDYLTIDFFISAGSENKLSPNWKKILLVCGKTEIPTYKTWAERQDIQKDSEIKSRVIFLRPNIGSSLSNCILNVPVKNMNKNLKLGFK
jgi:hypothetical protein